MSAVRELVAVQSNYSDEDTLRRITRYITSPPENSRVFTITPGVAEELLRTHNEHNRPKKPTNIAKYAGHMSSGSWAVTGDTIKFSDAGLLRDGQNRLMACVRSGESFRTHIVFGIDDDAFSVMDQGKNRDGSDILSIAGYQNTATLASAIRWAYLLDSGRVKSRASLEPVETKRLLEERYPDMPDFVLAAKTIYRLTGQPTGIVAAALYLFNKANPSEAEKFATAWASGEHSGRFTAIGKLQKAIAGIAAVSSGRVHDTVRAALIVRTWNAYVQGRRGTQADFNWTPSEDFPVIEG